MNLLGIRTEIRNLLNRPNLAALTDTLLNSWVNEAQTVLANERDWWFRQKSAPIATADGTQPYNLPTDFQYANSVHLTITGIAYRLEACDEQELVLEFATTDEGEPTHFAIREPETDAALPQILFGPVPDKVYAVTVKYHARLTALALNTDSNRLTTDYGWILVYLGAKQGFLFLHEEQRAQAMMMEAAKIHSQLVHFDTRRFRQRRTTLVPRMDAGPDSSPLDESRLEM